MFTLNIRAPELPSSQVKAGHCWPTCKKPFEWRFAGGLIVTQDYAG